MFGISSGLYNRNYVLLESLPLAMAYGTHRLSLGARGAYLRSAFARKIDIHEAPMPSSHCKRRHPARILHVWAGPCLKNTVLIIPSADTICWRGR